MPSNSTSLIWPIPFSSKSHGDLPLNLIWGGCDSCRKSKNVGPFLKHLVFLVKLDLNRNGVGPRRSCTGPLCAICTYFQRNIDTFRRPVRNRAPRPPKKSARKAPKGDPRAPQGRSKGVPGDLQGTPPPGGPWDPPRDLKALILEPQNTDSKIKAYRHGKQRP